MKQYIRKADIILLIILIIIGVASTIFVVQSKSGGDTVIIESNGKLYGKYSLYEHHEITVEAQDKAHSHNVVIIDNGKVFVAESSCQNQVCVQHRAINRTGESIICLPNRLVVRIEGKGGGYDTITS